MAKTIETSTNYLLPSERSQSSETSQPNRFLIYYQCVLAMGMVAIFFTRLDVFLEQKGFIVPLYWLYGFIAFSIPLWFLLSEKIKYLLVPVLGWCALYIAINTLSILASDKIPDTQLFEDRLRSIIFLLFAVFIFSEHPLVHKCTKVAMLLVTLMNASNHIYEMLNPFAFGALHAFGRPAGFYIDSNAASCALILGMIFSIDLLKPKYRMLYASFVGIGVVLSFSRGGMLGWLVAVLLLSFLKTIPRSQLVYLFLGLIGLYLLLKTQINTLTYLKNFDGSPLLNQDVLSRIEWILNPTSESQDLSRFTLVEDAWQQFYDSPWLGQGLGGAGSSTFVSGFDGSAQRPHNIYLTNMVEHGIIGFLLLPSLIYAAICKARGKTARMAIPFAIFILMWGLFSHTILSSFFILLSFAFMSNLAVQSRIEAK